MTEQQITISTIMSLLADEQMDHMADYVRRKRPLSAVPLERLSLDWIREFRLFMGDPADPEVNNRLEDVEAEMSLRGAELPREAIRTEAMAFVERNLARAWALPLEDKARINEALTRDLQRHIEQRGMKQ